MGEGDESRASSLIGGEVTAALAGTDSWYWRDRAVIALAHVLLPDTRAAWAAQPLGAPHRHGVVLSEALEAGREGDMSAVAALAWPKPGLVRANFPLRWLAELVALAVAAGNPPPPELIDAIGPAFRSALEQVAQQTASEPVVAAVRALLATLPGVPSGHLDLRVLGPLSSIATASRSPTPTSVANESASCSVTSSCIGEPGARRSASSCGPSSTMAGRTCARRSATSSGSWSPIAAGRAAPYFVRVEGPWLSLVAADRLVVDAWELEARLDDAGVAEQASLPSAALAAYRSALALWRGQPYVDAPYAAWADNERTRLRVRYTAAAVRGGELELAAGAHADATAFGLSALDAEPYSEPAHRLLVRAQLAAGDRIGARRALDACASRSWPS